MLEKQELEIGVVRQPLRRLPRELAGLGIIRGREQPDEDRERAGVRGKLRDVLAVEIGEFLLAPRFAVKLEQALDRRSQGGIVKERGAEREGFGGEVGGGGLRGFLRDGGK